MSVATGAHKTKTIAKRAAGREVTRVRLERYTGLPDGRSFVFEIRLEGQNDQRGCTCMMRPTHSSAIFPSPSTIASRSATFTIAIFSSPDWGNGDKHTHVRRLHSPEMSRVRCSTEMPWVRLMGNEWCGRATEKERERILARSHSLSERKTAVSSTRGCVCMCLCVCSAHAHVYVRVSARSLDSKSAYTPLT
jgi:hypothetical protein